MLTYGTVSCFYLTRSGGCSTEEAAAGGDETARCFFAKKQKKRFGLCRLTLLKKVRLWNSQIFESNTHKKNDVKTLFS
jgi:hypothetical protein